jgi:hypothetical protein
MIGTPCVPLPHPPTSGAIRGRAGVPRLARGAGRHRRALPRRSRIRPGPWRARHWTDDDGSPLGRGWPDRRGARPGRAGRGRRADRFRARPRRRRGRPHPRRGQRRSPDHGDRSRRRPPGRRSPSAPRAHDRRCGAGLQGDDAGRPLPVAPGAGGAPRAPARIPGFAAALLRARTRGATRFAPSTLRLLAELEWPGNLRDLEGVVHQVAEHRSAGDVPIADLPPGYREQRGTGVQGALRQAERDRSSALSRSAVATRCTRPSGWGSAATRSIDASASCASTWTPYAAAHSRTS